MTPSTAPRNGELGQATGGTPGSTLSAGSTPLAASGNETSTKADTPRHRHAAFITVTVDRATARHATTRRDMEKPPVASRGRSFSGGVDLSSSRSPRGDPGFYFRAVPSHSARSEIDPLRKFTGLLKSRNVLRAVGYAVNRLQAFLVNEPKVRHRNSPCLGSIAMQPG